LTVSQTAVLHKQRIPAMIG